MVRRVIATCAPVCGMLPSSADIRADPKYADIRVNQASAIRHQIGVLHTSRLG
jgi:hypothetical protein